MLTDHKLRQINGLQTKALMFGAIGCAIAIGAGFISAGPRGVFEGFLIAYILVLALGAGCLAAVMLHHLCGGGWSFLIQRICEAGARTLPFFLVLGVIVLGGANYFGVYPWTDVKVLESIGVAEIVGNKELFLNNNMFFFCTFLYFAIWIAFAKAFTTWSRKLDITGDVKYIAKMKFWAGPGLVLYVLTMTFAATHWVMSVEPEWFSTIFGAWLMGGYNLTVVAFCVLMLSFLADEPSVARLITERHYHHLGNFLLGFTVFWAYISFSQFLLIWNGNLPEEIHWYLHRTGDSLNILTVILCAAHWFVPMMILLIRKNKTQIATLRKIACYILVVRFIDIYWNMAPSYYNFGADGEVVYPNAVEPMTLIASAAACIGVAGIWFFFYLGQLKKYPIIPENDARIELQFLNCHAHGDHDHNQEAASHA